jgi:hypothetical protein
MANACEKIKRLMGANNVPQTSVLQNARNAVGSSLGQAAFNFVGEKVPKIAVDANVNGGVRALVDAVNTGTRSFAGSTINQASNAVLTAAGINGSRSLLPADPQGQTIFNDGLTAANTIGNSLISGVIEAADLPGPINSLSALAFLQQNQANAPIDITDPDCGITPYARDLIQYAPKHNFMFMVKFIFRPDYADLGVQQGDGDRPNRDEQIKFHYLCKKFTRPDIDIEYEEVNMYNFRTKVARKITYGSVDLSLFDDIQNSSMVFLEKYLKIRSPIANLDPSQGGLYDQFGMRYTTAAGSGGNADPQGSSASMGGLINANKSVLEQVEVYHIYEYANRVNKFTFINPKITQFRLSDFDMAGDTEPAAIDLSMSYDSMHIETGISVNQNDIKERSQLGERFMRKYG